MGRNSNREFDELYEKYCNEVKSYSGGLVETNKADFLKMYSFYSAVVYPDINKHMNKLYDFVAKLK